MADIDQTFAALSDPTRRGVVDLLRRGPHRAGELADALKMSRPAMSRHLRVLRSAELVTEQAPRGDARVRLYELNQRPFSQLHGWVSEIEAFWDDQLGSFKQHVERSSKGEEDVSTDRARASVLVQVDAAEAFRAFVEDIDQWWRRGLKYRAAGARSGLIHLESKVGGRLFESFDTARGTRTVEVGRVLTYAPPEYLAFSWRTSAFAAEESTLVKVAFVQQENGTLVTVTHSGWDSLRADHTVRHGLDRDAFVSSQGLWWGGLLTALRMFCSERE